MTSPQLLLSLPFPVEERPDRGIFVEFGDPLLPGRENEPLHVLDDGLWRVDRHIIDHDLLGAGR